MYPGSGKFRAAMDQAPADQQPLLRRLTDWAEQLDAAGMVVLKTYRGKNAITTLLPRLPTEDAGLATIYQEPKAAYLQLWPSVFARRAPKSLAAVEAALGEPVRNGAKIRHVTNDLLHVLTSAYREATQAGTAPT
ncbi:hypothetical protein GCM10023170_065190 [Phytohabitans houttuyneae]|uniref:Uncharacterized protein n=2 Tax=Phytohabitans houttuyneae TaxID=1076126 RepID=A0A6V8KEJ3_9ACTN|nr:hypothetical protein Phou_060300 [Phytohabitans houttuyneae]